MRIFLQKSVPIQPKTSNILPKYGLREAHHGVGLDRVLLEVRQGLVLVLGAIGVPALQGAVLGADLSMGLPLFFVPVYRCFDYRYTGL